MNQTSAHRILIIDHPQIKFGDLIAFVLKHTYNDAAQIVLSRDAGWVSLESEPAELIFIHLRANGEEPKGCGEWLQSLWHPRPVDRSRLTNAAEFCQRLRSIPAYQQVPVIVFGGLDPRELYAELQEVGATGYLSLPCDTEAIIAARDAAVLGKLYYP